MNLDPDATSEFRFRYAVPKGRKPTAQGFNPGKMPAACIRPEGASENVDERYGTD
jgi:hypothetical protein